MGKIKSKKHDTFIDMTAMSDVTVLLLTFFMLTATFIPKEPVQVITPSSVSEVKIPESNVMTILIDTKGQIFMNLDRPEDRKAVLQEISEKVLTKVEFTPKQVTSFVNQTHIGVPLENLQSFLDKDLTAQDEILKTKEAGIPTDTISGKVNQLAIWITTVFDVNPDISIAVKADQDTPYTQVKKVMSTLQDLKKNRYSLVTSLKGMPKGF